MNINATIFVQIINFSVVYWLLRVGLFKPVFAIINRQEENKTSLINTIGQQKTVIEAQELERAARWQECREYCKKHRPKTKNSNVLIDDTSVFSTQEPETILSADVIDGLADQVSQQLREKIKHVH